MCKVVKNGKTHTEDIYSAKFFLTLRDSQGHHIEYETHHLLQNTYSTRSTTTTDVEELEQQFVFEHIIGKQCCYYQDNDTTVTKKKYTALPLLPSTKAPSKTNCC